MKSSSVMLLDTPLKTKTFLLWRLQNGKTLVVTPSRFPRKLVAFWIHSAGWQIFGSISYKNPAILRLLDTQSSKVLMVLPQFAHDPYLGVDFQVSTCGNEWSPVFVARGRHGGLTSRWEGR